MAELKYFQAITHGLRSVLAADDAVFVMGEDVGHPEGIFAQMRGLQREFGHERVRDTPAGETGFFGAAVGAAITGMRPVIEISFADFFPACMDQVVNQAAKIRYMSGGQVTVPLTVLSFGGAGLNAGPQHSGTYEAWLGSVPGWKVATPATPHDACALVRTAVLDDDPTAVIFHKGMLQRRGEVPDDPVVALGEAAVRRIGSDVTLVGWSGSAPVVDDAAEELARSGIECEVIDMRSIQPLDIDTVLESVGHTHRLVIAQETTGFCGVGAEIAARVMAEAFDELDAPVTRVHAPFVPVPYSPPLERFVLPDSAAVVRAVQELVA